MKWLLGAVLALGVALGVWNTLPPTPLPVTAPADQFSAARAMADVRMMAARPHPAGSLANEQVRTALAKRLESLGFQVRSRVAPLPAKAAERLVQTGGTPATTATSLIAVRPGTAPGASSALPAVALMAHHDSVVGSPGAADDAAGVAAALEVARAIPASRQKRDLVLLITDAEELGLVGARDIFGTAPAGDPIAGHIGSLINMETRGGGGRASMFETGFLNGEGMRLFAGVVPDPEANSLAVTLYKLLPNSTDFTPAQKTGVQGFNFAFIGRPELYHSPLATPDRLEQGALQHLGSQVLPLTAALLAADTLPGPAPDLTFASIKGLGTLAYPPAWGWALLALAALLMWRAALWRRGEWTVAGIAVGMVETLLTILLFAGLATLLNLASGSKGGEYYDRMAAIPLLEVMTGLTALAVLLLAMAWGRRSRWDRWLGAAKLLALAAAALQWFLPGGAPVLAWPLLLVTLAMVWAAIPRTARRGEPLSPVQLLPAMLLAVPGLGWLLALAHFVFLGLGAPLPAVVAPLLLPVLALLMPLFPDAAVRAGARKRKASPLPLPALLLLAGALALALWVRLDPVAPSVPPYAGIEKKQG